MQRDGLQPRRPDPQISSGSSCQRSIVIPSAPSAEQAAEEAKKQFAELEGIRDWKIHAALIEVEAVDFET
jgi:hypothetical protein